MCRPAAPRPRGLGWRFQKAPLEKPASDGGDCRSTIVYSRAKQPRCAPTASCVPCRAPGGRQGGSQAGEARGGGGGRLWSAASTRPPRRAAAAAACTFPQRPMNLPAGHGLDERLGSRPARPCTPIVTELPRRPLRALGLDGRCAGRPWEPRPRAAAGGGPKPNRTQFGQFDAAVVPRLVSASAVRSVRATATAAARRQGKAASPRFKTSCPTRSAASQH